MELVLFEIPLVAIGAQALCMSSCGRGWKYLSIFVFFPPMIIGDQSTISTT